MTKWFGLLALSVSAALADTTVEIAGTRDTTLYSELPENSNGAGQNLFVGWTRRGGERRALVSFEGIDDLPPGTIVTAVTLTLTSNQGMGVPIPVALHRVLGEWGESSAGAPDPGGEGVPAEAGDATWAHRIFPDVLWENAGADFDGAVLGRANVTEAGRVVFLSTSPLVEVVQGWLDGTIPNHGLLLRSESTQLQTAKRLGTREQPQSSNQPLLTITLAGESALNVSGLWFDPATAGEGYNVISSDAGTTIFFYGYDNSGGRLWLVSDTMPDVLTQDQTTVFPLFVAGAEGNFAVPPAGGLRSYGTLEVNFSSCEAGEFVIDGDDGRKVSQVVSLATTGRPCVVQAAAGGVPTGD